MLMYAVKRNRLDLIRMVLAHGANIHAANYHGETALTFARDLSLENDDDILMMLTDAAGDLPWNRLHLGWLVPESEQLVSENAQFVYRKLERMHGSRGSKVRKASRARSRSSAAQRQAFQDRLELGAVRRDYVYTAGELREISRPAC